MTATERLRQILDKRGVEWTANDGEHVKETCWPYMCEMMAAFAEYDNGTTHFACDTWCFTPEQAVEATLGRGTCKNVSDFPKYEFVCSACGGRLDILDEFDNPTVQHADGSFRPRFCPSCGRKVE